MQTTTFEGRDGPHSPLVFVGLANDAAQIFHLDRPPISAACRTLCSVDPMDETLERNPTRGGGSNNRNAAIHAFSTAARLPTGRSLVVTLAPKFGEYTFGNLRRQFLAPWLW
jgi:hypothetical protein